MSRGHMFGGENARSPLIVTIAYLLTILVVHRFVIIYVQCCMCDITEDFFSRKLIIKLYF